MQGMDRPSALQRITSFNGPWPLLDATFSREHEKAALAQHSAGSLMDAAGLAVAKLALAQWPRARHVAVWAGPGNNGGDGLVAARHLHQAGLSVQVHLLAEPARLPEDAARALSQAVATGVSVKDWADAGSDMDPAPDLVIDALLGLGVSRAPEGRIAQAITLINQRACAVLAVDLPTGLHPDTGALLGDEAVRASATVSLLNLKQGCFTGQGRDHAGQTWLCDLGHPSTNATARLMARPPTFVRWHASHKGSYGDVAVVGGAPGMAGAAWLASAAAGAAGAGRVYACLLDPHAQTPPRPEIMTRRAYWQASPAQLAASTVVAGCGGSHAVAAVLPPLLAHAGRLVLDADALNAIANDAALLALLQHRRRPSLITPHPLEAARLLSCSAGEVQADRLGAARQLVELTHAAVLLKGSGTVLAGPGATPAINFTGNAALATAGTGDVLAGWCAGLWSAAPGTSAFDVAAHAAWLHGDAADRFAARHPNQPLRATELIDWLANAD
jgi:hydroxyethylthiazole kinase-like uncharacterized protein yjeF